MKKKFFGAFSGAGTGILVAFSFGFIGAMTDWIPDRGFVLAMVSMLTMNFAVMAAEARSKANPEELLFPDSFFAILATIVLLILREEGIWNLPNYDVRQVMEFSGTLSIATAVVAILSAFLGEEIRKSFFAE